MVNVQTVSFQKKALALAKANIKKYKKLIKDEERMIKFAEKNIKNLKSKK